MKKKAKATQMGWHERNHTDRGTHARYRPVDNMNKSKNYMNKKEINTVSVKYLTDKMMLIQSVSLVAWA